MGLSPSAVFILILSFGFEFLMLLLTSLGLVGVANEVVSLELKQRSTREGKMLDQDRKSQQNHVQLCFYPGLISVVRACLTSPSALNS